MTTLDVAPRTPSAHLKLAPTRLQGAPSNPARVLRIRRALHAATLLGVAGIVALTVWGVASGVLTSVASLREFVEGFGPLAPVAFILVGALEAVVPVIPGSGTMTAAPIIFGQVAGTIYAYVATVLGSIVVFAITRLVGRDLLEARFSPRTLERHAAWLEHPKFTRYFAIAIAAPLAPDDLLCYVAGLTRMRWRTYLLIIFLCKPWGVLLYTTGVMALLRAVFPWMGL